LRPLELISRLWGYFSHSYDRTNPIENQNSPQWDPIWPFGAGPAPINKAIMALKERAKLASKMALYFAHQYGPTLGAKTERLNLQCGFICSTRVNRAIVALK